MRSNVSRLQESFLKGSAPKNMDGFYKGKLELLIPGTLTESIGGFVSKFWLPWYGKEFNRDKEAGNNLLSKKVLPIITLLFGKSPIVRSEKQNIYAFPFTTRVTKGLTDNIEILQLDYDLKENPKQVRNIVDELVDIGNNTYLGKAYSKKEKAPRLVAFFSLRK